MMTHDIVRLFTRGNSTGLIIPSNICKYMGITPGTLLGLTVSPDKLQLTLEIKGYREPFHQMKGYIPVVGAVQLDATDGSSAVPGSAAPDWL